METGFQSSEEFPHLVMRELEESEQQRASFRITLKGVWEQQAGVVATEEMLRSRDSAERYLEHPELVVRLAALQILEQFWRVPWADLGRDLRVRKLWQDLAGPSLTEAMLRDRGVAEQCLADSDPKVSMVARHILRNQWGVLLIRRRTLRQLRGSHPPGSELGADGYGGQEKGQEPKNGNGS